MENLQKFKIKLKLNLNPFKKEENQKISNILTLESTKQTDPRHSIKCLLQSKQIEKKYDGENSKKYIIGYRVRTLNERGKKTKGKEASYYLS